MVFVLDRHKKPLMPCTPRRARLLLARKRAVVHRLSPFTIRLKDRSVQQSTLQPVALKIDPGAKTTGLALARVEETSEGEVHHALHLAELSHRGEEVRDQLRKRAGYRRRRRSTNLRYRPARFLNRRRAPGWLPPSLRSRIDNVLSWGRRYQRWVPLVRIAVERVKFDTQLLQQPEISGVEYQRGELAGWEVRAYLLEKFGRRCVYCGRTDTPFELDHIQPRSRGGSNRVSNLALSCHTCNAAKGERTAAEFGHPEVAAQAKQPLRDTAAVNATRYALCDELRTLDLPLTTWSGGRTRWNRARFSIPKTHALDALCVGEVAGVKVGAHQALAITATGRGRYSRTNVDESGFPVGSLMRRKQVLGIKTGDRVRAMVPEGFAAQGTHTGRIAVRANKHFRMGKVQGIPARFCRVLQLADGYDYAVVATTLQG
ncbi:RNA-guided endonuclease IscB [Ktedonobacter racemifer]|uniref:HNH endonuclease n=1 Tax=Ktedonobacter racemifer DSM 44963 TaxID=485913 RepID=D6U6D0_KTERA|nr:HNH endonuclease [Ktedonobacter racemifer DSM 44963]